jgi:hypothetical protein
MDPDSLALNGYLVFADSTVSYWAPDLEVMLSRSFANSHCFRTHPSAKSDALVGVDFAPAPGIKHADIEGTFWLDLASRELRSLEFTYANLAFTKADTLAGGRVRFMRLPTGDWIIPDWVIRAPAGYYRGGTSGLGLTFQRLRVADVVPRLPKPSAVGIKRGELISVTSSTDKNARPTWSRPTGTLRFRVASRDGKDAPQSGAVVRLPESTRQAVTDSAGMAEFDGLIEGDYIVEVAPLSYDVLSELGVRSIVTLSRDDSEIHTVRVATAEQIIDRICPAMRTRGLLLGRVTQNGVPLEGALISAILELDPDKAVMMTLDPSSVSGFKRDSVGVVHTTSAGSFKLCGAPRTPPYTLLRVQVTTKYGKTTTATVFYPKDQLYAWVDIALDPP